MVHIKLLQRRHRVPSTMHHTLGGSAAYLSAASCNVARKNSS